MRKTVYIFVILILGINDLSYSQYSDSFKLLSRRSDFTLMYFNAQQKGYILGKEISYMYDGTNWNVKGGIYSLKNPSFVNNYGFALTTDSINNNGFLYSINGGESWGTRGVANFANTYFEDIMFTDVNTGWIVGSELTNYFIIKTTNNGLNWNKQITLPTPRITSIYMLDSLRGFITPYHLNNSSNFILKTTNGGVNWNPIHLYTISRLTKVFFTDDQHGWIFGNVSTSMRTTDGGATWIQGSAPTSMKSVFMLNSSTGWFGGTNGYVYKTTNGGVSWLSQGLIGSEISSIHFKDINTGWACISSGSLVKTTNSGVNWIKEIDPFPNKINSGATADGREFYINGNNVLYRLENYGQKYSQVLNVGPIKEVETFGGDTVYLLSNKFYKTTNKGVNWVSTDIEISNCADFVTKDIGYIGGTGWGGKILKTSNGGNNWVLQYLESDTNLNNYEITNIHFLNANTGFVATYYCQFFKTTNGGANWQKLPVVPGHSGNYRVASISPVDENNVFVYLWGSYTIAQYTFYQAEFLKTSNGGNNWNSVSYVSSLSGPPSFRKMQFANNTTGYMWTGSDLAKTNDGGVNYGLLQYNGGLISNYYFKDNGSAWLYGIKGTILTNTNINVAIHNTSTEIPSTHLLHQNYPNPFNPSTKIKFDIPKGSLVKLEVYDILGREVAELVNEKLNAGVYEYEWNGAGLTSGVYFYRLQAGEFSETKRMVLVK